MNDPPIPVNIITGFLGVGKTTTLLSLLAHRPCPEPWAVLVNEFGKVAIDPAAMRALGEDGMQIAEVAGGCLCCTAGINMQVAMSRLINEAAPARILIEPTGLGHPARIRDLLTGGSFSGKLQPAPTLCLVDPRQYINPRFKHLLTYWEQVKCADVVVLNKTDLVDAATLQACRDKLVVDYPDKPPPVEVEQGQVSPHWLDAVPGDPSADSPGGSVSSPHHAHGEEQAEVELLGGRVRRLESSGLGRHACGWVLHPDIVLSHDALADWVADPDGHGDLSADCQGRRLKGVLRTDRGWWLYNAVGTEATWQPVEASPDSRIECISAGAPLPWGRVEERLLACIRT